jgi:hypothetical protein
VVGGAAGRGRGRPVQAISSALRLARVVLFTLETVVVSEMSSPDWFTYFI